MGKHVEKRDLPRLMVAPNGARRGRSTHPALPTTDQALIQTATACARAGADGIHIHIRDDDGLHLLDAGRYHALLDQLTEAVPDLYLQVTSEAAGRYDTDTQQAMMRTLKPRHVSVALREMVRTPNDWVKASEFYHWAEETGVDVQHIVYSTDELWKFIEACAAGKIPETRHLLQLVLGTYDGTQKSCPEDIEDFTALMTTSGLSIDWGLCAFGKEETACLIETARLGGKARVGFENSLWNADGSIATDNAARVREVRAGIDALI